MIREVISGFIAEIKNIFSLSDMAWEWRLVYSLIVSMSTMFVFIAITGDLWAGLGLGFIFEIILLFIFNVRGS